MTHRWEYHYHMDDTTGISLSHEEAGRAKDELGWHYKVKDLGEADMILGIYVERNRDAGTISISQCAYLKQVLKLFGMSDCNTKSTSLPPDITLSKDQSPKSQEDHKVMADKPY
jgi:Reverse transcriptase (RNA-dependent DNA polymerase)